MEEQADTHFTYALQNFKMADITRTELAFNTKANNSFSRSNLEVHMVSHLEFQAPPSIVYITVLPVLSYL